MKPFEFPCKTKRFIMQLMWAGVTGIFCTGCLNDEKSPEIIIEPPIPPVETEPVQITAKIEAAAAEDSTYTFFSTWPEKYYLVAVSYQKGYYMPPQTSSASHLPGTICRPVQGVGTPEAVFKGDIIKGADSLAVYRVGFDGKIILHDLVTGSAKIEDPGNVSISLRHRSAALDLKLINRTGNDLQIESVTLHPLDDSKPFYLRPETYLTAKIFNDEESKNGFLTVTPQASIKKDTLLTVRFAPLLLENDSVLNGKALHYLIKTDRGIYTYTLPGTRYEGGNSYTEEITLEGM